MGDNTSLVAVKVSFAGLLPRLTSGVIAGASFELGVGAGVVLGVGAAISVTAGYSFVGWRKLEGIHYLWRCHTLIILV